MVPVWKGKDSSKARFCIDLFEFPNRACELPMVWGSPTQAARVCQLEGKRLCAQEEWNLACAGDPEGGPNQVYAYGNELDLDACNMQRPHDYLADGRNWSCNVFSAQTAWTSCATDTEPAGSFPRCRSRFGVFDQHGNVAEMMTRKAGENDPTSKSGTVTQLKGSAFFYVDVARQHDRPHPKDAKRDTYPDHCAYDPRWHVEPIEAAYHVNYHLGFRCCKSL
jgi:formylglycine-generating enzyme required for sulfatase activity